MQSGVHTKHIKKTKFKETRYMHQRSEGMSRRDSMFERKYQQSRRFKER